MSDLFIGSNRINAGCSWVIFSNLDFISRNSVSYYIHDLLDPDSHVTMIVMKDTPEGIKISNAIMEFEANKISKEVVRDVVDEIFLKKSSLQSIKSVIETIKMKYYREGRKDKAHEFRDVLNSN